MTIDLSTTTLRPLFAATAAMAVCARANSAAKSSCCLAASLLVELRRDRLLIGRALALDRGLELRREMLLECGELLARRLERGKIADGALVDEADVGDVGRERLRRDEQKRCRRQSGEQGLR